MLHQERDRNAAESQPANLYAPGALTYAVDAAKGVKLKPGEPGIGAPKLAGRQLPGRQQPGDPIVAPFVTKTALPFTEMPGGRPARQFTTTAVTDGQPLGKPLLGRARWVGCGASHVLRAPGSWHHGAAAASCSL